MFKMRLWGQGSVLLLWALVLVVMMSCSKNATGPEGGSLNIFLMPSNMNMPIEGDSTNVDDVFRSYFGDDVADAVATVTGAAMNTIVKTLDLSLENGMLYASIADIPSGSRRTVVIELKSETGLVLFAGQGTASISGGKDTDVTIRLESDEEPVLALPDSMKVNLDFVFVDGGTFEMGSEGNNIDETPIHSVTLSNYYISRTEVTNAMFCHFLNEIGAEADGTVRGRQYMMFDDPDHHVNMISYSQQDKKFVVQEGFENYPVAFVYSSGASAFCSWLGVSLPTEAQWEFAARGGVLSGNYLYAGSNTAEEVGWFDENSEGHAHPVAQKTPNELGVYDMSGNNWELCRDGYSNYPEEAVTDPVGWGGSSIIRGGSWFDRKVELRSANRDFLSGGNASYIIGFRCAVSTY